MHLLILTQPGDIHALAVATALQFTGNAATICSVPSKAGEMTSGVLLDSSRVSLEIQGNSMRPDDVDVVWLRRRARAVPPRSVHQDDRQFVFRENARYWAGIWPGLAGSARWISPPGCAEAGENKLLQLRLAIACGFNVPRSLFSNDASQIRAFIRDAKAAGHETIYKTFTPAAWTSASHTRVKHTTTIDESDLIAAAELAVTPGIFQHLLPKSYEVRANFFGDEVVAVKINSQAGKGGEVDWRDMQGLSNVLEPIGLDDELKRKCRSIMHHLGISMACFDLIVCPRGETWFVELNQQGQFLWIEEALPEIPLLDTFRRFVAPTPHRDDGIRLADVIGSDAYAMNRDVFLRTGVVHASGQTN